MRQQFWRAVRDERGATSIEYGLLATFIAVVMILGASTVGNALSGSFQGIALALTVDRGNAGTDSAGNDPGEATGSQNDENQGIADNASDADANDSAGGLDDNENDGVGAGDGGSNDSDPNAGDGKGKGKGEGKDKDKDKGKGKG